MDSKTAAYAFYNSEDGTVAFLDDGIRRQQEKQPPLKEPLLSRDEKIDQVDKLLALPDFPERLGRLLKSTSDKFLPEVTVRFENVTAVAQALKGTANLPSLSNTAIKAFERVTCRNSLPTTPVTLLHNMSGVLRPGRATLLLGPPGAGKSLFLGIIGGRTKPNSRLNISGSITYNGVEGKDFVVERTVGFIPQEDMLIPELTVDDTVSFAYQCLVSKSRRKWLTEEIAGGEEKFKAAIGCINATDKVDVESQDSMSDEEFYEAVKKLAASGGKPEAVLAILGLMKCSQTRVGNALKRGVSGGERRRVACAEILVGPQAVILADQISNGLDSATTFSVIQFLVRAVRALRKTCVVSLLQPAPEVMDLFDDLMLLSDGHLLYHGTVSEAVPWFSQLGFSRPPRKDPCSFLQELTLPIGQFTYATPALLEAQKVKPLQGASAEKVAAAKTFVIPLEELTNRYWASNGHALQMKQDLDQQKQQQLPPILPVRGLWTTAFSSSPFQLGLTVWKRQRALVNGLKLFFISRMVQALIMGVLRGSMFWQIPKTPAGGRLVMSCNMMTIVFLSMLSTPQIQLVYQNKNVFIKQRTDKFYPPWTWAIAFFLTQLPQSFMEAAIYSTTIYFMSGFDYSAAYFFKFFAVTFTGSNTLAAITRLVAFVFPSRVLATAAVSLIILVNMITNGFNILQNDIPWYIRWYYYINPVAYGLSALNVNELTSPQWMIPFGNTSEALGIQILETFQFRTDPNWLWVTIGYLLGLLAVVLVASCVALKFTSVPGPQPYVPDEEDEEKSRDDRAGSEDSNAAEAAKDAGDLPYTALDKGPAADGSEPLSMQHIPLTIVCRNLNYCVPTPKRAKPSPDAIKPGTLQLLRDVTFYSLPGRLTALMGGTGAGKTTLMDVVCGRKTIGDINGDILVNGHPKEQKSWARVMGYVEQQNLHSPELTVYEALYFSASLRLSHEIASSPEAVKAAVEDALRMTELSPLRNSITGVSGGSGLSNEALKRLSIAVELVANPSVLFMDEPTTGLDARAAAIVVRALKAVAATQRTIIVTIHQPSMDVFESFDDLLLLKTGGKIIYFGPIGVNSSGIVNYFQGFPNVVALSDGYNPATWMLEVTGSAMSTVFKASDQDFGELYASSALCAANAAKADELAAAGAAEHAPLTVASKYAAPIGKRYRMVTWKVFLVYWRTPTYNFARLAMTLFVALLYGLVYLNEGKIDPDGTDIGAVQNVLGLIFSMAVFVGMSNANNVLALVSAERAIYYRETAASMYGPWSYSVATGVAEIPYLLVQACTMVIISYWMVGFQPLAWKFFYYLLMYFTSIAMYTYMGQFLAFLMPSLLMALLVTSLCSQIWTILNGYVIPYDQIPVYWQWASRVTPAAWVIYGLGASQLGDVDAPMVGIDGTMTTVSEFLEFFFGYKFDFIWQCWVIVVAFAVFFRVGAAYALRYINYNKR